MERSQRLRAAQYRLAQHYLEKLQAAERTYQLGDESAVRALTMFDLDREQVQLQQTWIAAHAVQDEQAAALCSAYTGACPHLYNLRLLPQEYLSWLEAALEAARRLGDRRAEAAHLPGLYAAVEQINAFHVAIDYIGQALSIAQQLDDQPLVAKATQIPPSR